VKFEAERIFFAERVLLDEMEFLHGAEEAVDSGSVQRESEESLVRLISGPRSPKWIRMRMAFCSDLLEPTV